jgi:GT2 family glycosyltransferase
MIHVLLPAHNRIAVTRRFVQSLLNNPPESYHLILIDDGSTDGTAEMVCSLVPQTTVLRGSGSWWWGGSLHQGYLWARNAVLGPDDIIAIFNDDTMPSAGFMENARRLLGNRPNDLLIAVARDLKGKILEQKMNVDWLRLRFSPCAEGQDPAWCTTRGLCMRADIFLSLGGFYPRLLPHYLSDVEYTLRARRKGHRIFSDDSVTLTMDPDTTGNHLLVEKGLLSYFRKLFSKRTSHNPVYMTTFLFLAAPVWAIPFGLLKVWLLPVVEYFGFRRQNPAESV